MGGKRWKLMTEPCAFPRVAAHCDVGSSVRVFRQGHRRQRRHLMQLHLPRTRGAAFPASLSRLLRCPQSHTRGDTIDRAGSAEPWRAVGELGQRRASDGCAAAPRLLRRSCVPLAREQPALRPQKHTSGSAGLWRGHGVCQGREGARTMPVLESVLAVPSRATERSDVLR